jgi:hypothetical protein
MAPIQSPSCFSTANADGPNGVYKRDRLTTANTNFPDNLYNVEVGFTLSTMVSLRILAPNFLSS